ncbi:family 43 glycosylhydrolase [Pedobacter mucosus]|uniref:family 43 glycosylhydrolase n=1 Tax=Pedobacter mucosus TaxID=2895286 RepID=UPI001EE3C5DF|nr:family 43 glycosylhydrolase [Pedobacter mucosus]UKT64228.1 family 43 glycosylhydrolase [Pedobacter mucosus]
MKSKQIYFIISIALTIVGINNLATAQTTNIKNDIFWNTTDGKPIYSQGGGVFKFLDPATGKPKYFWYGVHYKEAELYLANPAITNSQSSTFEAVTCYSSTDLVNWTEERNVFTKESLSKLGKKKTWVGRLGVAYMKDLKKYALIVQYGNSVLISLADSPTGDFEWHKQIDMTEMIGTPNTGDQTVFTDEDTGKSYLVYSYGRGRNKIYVSEIGVKDGAVTLLDCNMIFKGESREGNCMFKYKGKYYMAASNIYGWDSSHAYYLVADHVKGPYLPTNDMLIMDGAREDYAHISQTGFFYTIRGNKQETVVYCGDRWADFAGNGLGYNQWVPISFNGDKPYFNSLNSWNLDAKTGSWSVAKDNNYVKNGSFEADRKRIPSSVKPIQEQLTGWFSEVITGSKIIIDTLSPTLNYFNTELDRKVVIGEKSLNMSDKIDFSRKVYQTISSSPFVKMNDGFYTLKAKVKNSAGFTTLEMYANSGGKNVKISFNQENSSWKTITLKKIFVKGGKLDIGFLAKGKANAICNVDDVVLLAEE